MSTTHLILGGLHCQGCAGIIRAELERVDGVSSVSIDYASNLATISYDDKKTDENSLIAAIRAINYSAEPAAANHKRSRKSYLYAAFAILAVILLIALSRSPLLGLTGGFWERDLTLVAVLAIGFISGFHCVGMCGGFVAAYTLEAAKSMPDKTWSPHIAYNAGRSISYTVIGALLGLIGSAFSLNSRIAGLITLAASLFMIGVGLQLLGVKAARFAQVNWLRWFPGLFSLLERTAKRSPLYLGLLTGLMPCGPLQAMQFYALSTGSPLRGAAALALYSVGTMPALFGLGRAITAIGRIGAGTVMRWAGAIVVILGLLSLGRGLALAGGGITFSAASPSPAERNSAEVSGEVQEVRMAVTYGGYEPNVIYLKAGIPVRWVIDGSGVTGCTDEIVIHGYDIRKKLTRGENIVEFIPEGPGEIDFSCWMNMVWGKFIVTADGEPPTGGAQSLESPFGQNGSCSGDASRGSCGSGCSGSCGATGCGCKR